MKSSHIRIIAVLMLVFSVLISCSKDKPTNNAPPPPSSALVGTWLRTTTLANGEVITEENDTLGVYDEDQIILRADGTGLASDEHGAYEILNWYIDDDYIVITFETLGIQRINFELHDNNTLSVFYPAGPGDEQYNIPDLEYIYTKQ